MSDMTPAVTPAPLIKVIDGKFVTQDEFKLAKLSLQELAEKITEVTNPDQYSEAMALVGKGKADVKLIEALAEPEIAAARTRLQQLRDDRDAVIRQVTQIYASAEAKARDWNLHVERPAALAEQKEINKGVKPSERVIVKPSIPSTGAARIVAHYRSKVTDAKKVKRKFLIPDEKAINAKARTDQDVQKTMREVGGVLVWIE